MGHGVGLWEHELPHHAAIEPVIEGDSKLANIAQELEDEMYDLDPDRD